MQVKLKSQKWLPYVLLSPSIIIITIFFIYPSFQSLYYSFFRVNMTGTRKIFVGLTNFIRLFKNPDYLNSLMLSLFFAVSVVFIGLFNLYLYCKNCKQEVSGVQYLQNFSYMAVCIIASYNRDDLGTDV